MGSVNKVTILGNLGADPELKSTTSGASVCNMRVATTETWKDKGGQKQEKTEWHRVTVWGVMGENCAKYLAKGRSVYVEGRIETRSYEKDGQKHFATDIIATNVVFLGGGDGEKREGGQSRGADSRRGGTPPADTGNGGHPPIDDSEIPF